MPQPVDRVDFHQLADHRGGGGADPLGLLAAPGRGPHVERDLLRGVVLVVRGPAPQESDVGGDDLALARIFAQRIRPQPCAGHNRPDRQSVAQVAAFRPVAAVVKLAGQGEEHAAKGTSAHIRLRFRCFRPLQPCALCRPQVRDAGAV